MAIGFGNPGASVAHRDGIVAIAGGSQPPTRRSRLRLSRVRERSGARAYTRRIHATGQNSQRKDRDQIVALLPSSKSPTFLLTEFFLQSRDRTEMSRLATFGVAPPGFTSLDPFRGTSCHELPPLNKGLEQRVGEQIGEIERMRRLRRFLPPQVADLIVSSGMVADQGLDQRPVDLGNGLVVPALDRPSLITCGSPPSSG